MEVSKIISIFASESPLYDKYLEKTKRGNRLIIIKISMKKVILMAVVAILATMGAKAQNEEGDWTIMPKGGYNMATWTGDPDAKWLSGFVAGLELEYGVNDNLGLVAGLNYSQQGERDDVHNTKIKFAYANIPLLVQYYPVEGLALKAGIQLGFTLSKKAMVDGVSYDIDKVEAYYGSSSSFSKFDLSIPMGVSYEYKRFVLDARYNLGLIKIVKDYSESYRNSVLQFTIGYKIPFSN